MVFSLSCNRWHSIQLSPMTYKRPFINKWIWHFEILQQRSMRFLRQPMQRWFVRMDNGKMMVSRLAQSAMLILFVTLEGGSKYIYVTHASGLIAGKGQIMLLLRSPCCLDSF